MTDCLIIIQARLGSTRLPNKVLLTVGGIPMVKRVWLAAKKAQSILKTYGQTSKVIVAWPERYPDLDERNVLERFRRISNEFPSKWIIRLTADCPLITAKDIVDTFLGSIAEYNANHKDGYDVQVFTKNYLMTSIHTSVEHVIADWMTKPMGLSVNTKYDLERVRLLAK